MNEQLVERVAKAMDTAWPGVVHMNVLLFLARAALREVEPYVTCDEAHGRQELTMEGFKAGWKAAEARIAELEQLVKVRETNLQILEQENERFLEGK